MAQPNQLSFLSFLAKEKMKNQFIITIQDRYGNEFRLDEIEEDIQNKKLFFMDEPLTCWMEVVPFLEREIAKSVYSENLVYKTKEYVEPCTIYFTVHDEKGIKALKALLEEPREEK